MNLKINNKTISILFFLISALLTLLICLFLRFYLGNFHTVDIGGYESVEAVYDISEIYWKNPDYDYITGTLSIDGKPVSDYPASIVFYTDESDRAYTLPLKLRNDIDPETEEKLEAKWDTRDFMFIDREYITDAGAPSDRSKFYCLIPRENDLRRTYKIGFLIRIDEMVYIIKTDEIYKYPDM